MQGDWRSVQKPPAREDRHVVGDPCPGLGSYMLDLEPNSVFREPFSWLRRKRGIFILMWMEAVCAL